MLDQSPLVANLLQGPRNHITLVVNGMVYQLLYVPIDGIYYPRKSIFVQMIHESQGENLELAWQY